MYKFRWEALRTKENSIAMCLDISVRSVQNNNDGNWECVNYDLCCLESLCVRASCMCNSILLMSMKMETFPFSSRCCKLQLAISKHILTHQVCTWCTLYVSIDFWFFSPSYSNYREIQLLFNTKKRLDDFMLKKCVASISYSNFFCLIATLFGALTSLALVSISFDIWTEFIMIVIHVTSSPPPLRFKFEFYEPESLELVDADDYFELLYFPDECWILLDCINHLSNIKILIYFSFDIVFYLQFVYSSYW